MKHNLKTIQPYFAQVKAGTKTFEHRVNDRNYQVGDTAFLQEYDPDAQTFSGDKVLIEITSVLTNRPGLAPGYCIFSFRRLGYDYRTEI